MTKEQLNACLKSFYTSARKHDDQFYKSSSLKSIRAAIDRYLRSPPRCKQFSIIADAAFTEANKILDAFVKDLRKSGRISGIVHKKAISKQQIQKLFESGELGPANTKDPAQLQRMAWFYLGLFFRRQGRANQQEMKPRMLCPQEKNILSSTGNFPAQYQRRKTIKEACQVLRTSLTQRYFHTRSFQMSHENNQELLLTLKSKTRCSFSAASGGEKF